MKIQIVLAIVISLGLSFAAMAYAQRPALQQPQSGEKAKLRSQVAKLRAEVTLLQLQNDADANFLRENFASEKSAEAQNLVKGALKGLSPKERETAGLVFDDKAVDKATASDELATKAARTLLDGAKKEFISKSVELNEKKLELAELEEQYHLAK
jgi:hypothetical protein